MGALQGRDREDAVARDGVGAGPRDAARGHAGAGTAPDGDAGAPSAEAARVREDAESALADAAAASLAYLAYWSFLITCVVFPVATQAAQGATLTLLPAWCGFASFAAAQAVVTKTGRLIGGRRALGAVGVGVTLSLPLLAAMFLSAVGVQAGLGLQAGAWLLWGVGQAALFPLVGIVQLRADSRLESQRAAPLLVAAALAGAALPCALALFAPDPLRSALPAAYLAAAVGLLLVGRARGLARDLPQAEGLSDRFQPLGSPKALAPFVIGATFNLLVCYCVARFGMAETLGVMTVASLLGGALILALVLLASRHLVNSFIERCYFPVMAAGFFALSFLPDAWRVVPACLCAALFFAYAAFHWGYLIGLARRLGIASPLHFATGLLSPATGMTVGWGTTCLFALAGGDLSHPVVLFFGWIVAYIIVLSVAPYASDPLFEADVLAPGDVLPDPADRSGNSWEQACDAIASACRLSPREREIFALLAHGRNVEYISTTLCISANTAKTHKYRIYRKLEVGTHQELLDRVEAAERAQLGGR